MSEDRLDPKTSNFYELLGLVINKFGYIGFFVILVGGYIHFHATEEQHSHLVDIILLREASYTQWILIGAIIIAIAIHFFRYERLLKTYQAGIKKKDERIRSLIDDATILNKDKNLIEISRKLKIKNEADEETMELKRIEEALAYIENNKKENQ